MGKINFYNADVKLPSHLKKPILRKSITDLCYLHAKDIEEISYIYCSDEYLLNINQTHLQHDYYTDIITFPMSIGDNLNGEIYISLDRVKDNAKKLHVDFDNELFRVMSHGMLHLIGYSDKSPKQKKIMRAEEDKAIAIFLSNF
jgi:rRNA maturation RNase YbeY